MTVTKAEQIARHAHNGQFRRDGVTPYITHIEDVVRRVGHGDWHVMVAWLHDVLEDTDEAAGGLRNLEFPEPVVHAVELLTKKAGEPYPAYLGRVIQSRLATVVKIADMISNLADTPTPQQVRKYAQGLEFLTR